MCLDTHTHMHTHTLQLELLPVSTSGVIEAYTTQFIRLLDLKALALVKYVEAELRSVVLWGDWNHGNMSTPIYCVAMTT